ncbi:MAG TPA: proprotein convertase P-domain-containing protein, partial [Bacteroidia bacterium]|nr:proprotein convertase P-domain-containing protein [Bacteroidia bacterium]
FWNGTSVSMLVNLVPLPVAPLISTGGPTTFCSGGSVQLTFSPSANTVYNWRQNGTIIPGATTSPYTAITAGNYDLIADSMKPFSIAPALSIPDNICTGASSTIAVSGYSGTLASSGISIRINITHTYDADLSLVLVAPNGSILGLANQIGSSGDNFTNTVFSDAGSGQIPATGAPYTGTYKPYTATFSNSCVTTTATSFGSLGGGSINPNGNWTLRAFDHAGADVGVINNWTITFPASLNSPCYTVSNTISVTVDPAPSIASFSPLAGTTGTPVVITGSGFTGTTTVSFNGSPATYVVNTPSQITATVPTGASTGLITVVTPCGTANSAVVFTITSGTLSLNLKLLIEGFYIGGGLMNGVISPSVCDTVTVKLANASSPYAFVYSSKDTINTSGQGSFEFSGISPGTSWYIVIQHRNSLETWSATPVVFNGSSVNYDFTTALNKAFGSNQVQVSPGKFAIRSGDVNQDGLIESADYSAVENNSQVF